MQVYNAETEMRNNILRAIIDHVHPLDLIPVAFGRDKNESYFFARNCGGAIQKLCNDNLVVPNPNNDSRPVSFFFESNKIFNKHIFLQFKLKLVLRYITTSEFKIDVQKNILTVLNKRYDSAKRTLNLSKFHEDQGNVLMLYISEKKIMQMGNR